MVRLVAIFLAVVLTVSLSLSPALIRPGNQLGNQPGNQLGLPMAYAATDNIYDEPDELQRRVERSAENYNEAVARLAAVEAEIEEVQIRIDDLQMRLPEQKAKTSAAVNEYYRLTRSGNYFLELIFGSASFIEFLSNLEYTKRIQDSYTAEFERMKQMNIELKGARAILEEDRQLALEELNRAEAALAEAQAAREEARQRALEQLRLEQEAAAAAAAATFTVDKDAPMPPGDTERAPSLNLDGFSLVFDEDFSEPLDVSAWGPGTRWIAHTPWAGDFGDARFMDPEEGFPFLIKDGVLRIEARKSEEFAKDDGWKRPWRAGLLSSCDPNGNGFSLQYGYFEARMKMPPGPGVWPAFWLVSAYSRKTDGAGKDGSVEIDVVEYYGHFPSSYRPTLHVWEPGPHREDGVLVTTRPNEPSLGFHNYGVLVAKDFVTFYFDGVEVWKQATPSEHNKPLMLLVNLALGSGYSLENTPNPSFLDVEYVRAYTLPDER